MGIYYLVTGASGHLGNHVVRTLVDGGERVRVLAMENDPLTGLDNLDIEVARGNICRSETLDAFFDLPEGQEAVVIHMAARVSIASRFDPAIYEVNVGGVKTIVDRCLRHKVSRLVHVSSVHAIPEKPHGQIMAEVDHFSAKEVHGLYAKTKAEASQYVLDSVAKGLDAVIVHPSGLIGPNDYHGGNVSQLIMDYSNGKLPASVKGGYDFADVRDVANAIVSAAAVGRCGQCYILSYKPFTIPELLGLISELSGCRPVKAIPSGLARLVAPIFELVAAIAHKPPLLTSYSMYSMRANCMFSNGKAVRELGYTNRPMRETLSDTLLWMENTGRIHIGVSAARMKTRKT